MISQLHPSDFAAWCENAGVVNAAIALPVVLDVREPQEVAAASITAQGFRLVHIPMREIPARISELQNAQGDSDAPIACLCHHGMRSMQVARYLEQNGFTGVVNLAGGIDAWSLQVDPSVPRY